jgi:hypothetical protein
MDGWTDGLLDHDFDRLIEELKGLLSDGTAQLRRKTRRWEAPGIHTHYTFCTYPSAAIIYMEFGKGTSVAHQRAALIDDDT